MNKLFYVVLASFMLTGCNSLTEVSTETVTETHATVTEQVDILLTPEAQAALATKVFYFTFDSAELSAEDRNKLFYHALALKGSTDLSIRLEGHASEEGTREYNIALGERRAKAVAAYLMANGVSVTQIEVISYGEERPAVQGATEDARSKNRRVEVK